MKWIVTGGCGFIGTNVVELLARDGIEPVVMDNLARPRVHQNLSVLRDQLGVEVHVADIRDRNAVDAVVAEHADAEVVLHLAGQVSFMASLADPRYDFETNAMGTFNVLDAVKRLAPQALVVYSSTNKVYGDLTSVRVEETDTRFVLPDFPHGIPTTVPLDLHGGYSCSKGAADQLVLDWAEFHGLRGVSLRQSSVYGGRQFSTEDQGWAAFFAERFVGNESYRISGTGKQVRDLIHVRDLYAAYRAVAAAPDQLIGKAFNIGGGPANSLSLLELFERLAVSTGNRPSYDAGPERPADQKVFVADIRPLHDALGWSPQIDLDHGLAELTAWAATLVASA